MATRFATAPLRVFFDAQTLVQFPSTPISAPILRIWKKENIKLLLTYEGNAAEYYDRFGRG